MGSLDLIGGPMFCGKTTEILRNLFTDAEIGLKVVYINHSRDIRADGPFSTHNPLYKKQLSTESKVTFLSANKLEDVYPEIQNYDVIGVDESQFFPDLYDQVLLWVNSLNKKVVLAGLSGDYKRKKFGQFLDLIPQADSYVALKSYCKVCAFPENHSLRKKRKIVDALFTHRFVDSEDQIKIGGSETYSPVCRKCYNRLNSE
jgi:thymidine kinase